MSDLERKLVEKIGRLKPEQQRQVMRFVQTLETTRAETQRTPSELMRLPLDERKRLVKAAFELASDEDFETFEAYSEESADEST